MPYPLGYGGLQNDCLPSARQVLTSPCPQARSKSLLKAEEED